MDAGWCVAGVYLSGQGETTGTFASLHADSVKTVARLSVKELSPA